ncbi:hypothetical protein Zmor_012997 [Zophobas morio]|uniref:Uncharacterized protein n=1 Tax=Zophobas morio TaxID=2755281 RepID=A0AA38ICG2_9CUCU|nr:hypothetical protein Zmor_012997 [Zophobas morio]
MLIPPAHYPIISETPTAFSIYFIVALSPLFPNLPPCTRVGVKLNRSKHPRWTQARAPKRLSLSFHWSRTGVSSLARMLRRIPDFPELACTSARDLVLHNRSKM